MKSKHTDEQLNWLRSRLPEYESRAAAQVRGDAKGFALRCAEEYIEKWGLGTGPDAEKESQVKEVRLAHYLIIYSVWPVSCMERANVFFCEMIADESHIMFIVMFGINYIC